MSKPRHFELVVVDLIKSITDGVELDPLGILKIYFLPPGAPHHPKSTGFMKPVYLASVAEKSQGVDLSRFECLKWMSAAEWKGLKEDEIENGAYVKYLVSLAHLTPRNQLAPTNLIAMMWDPLL